MRKYVVPQSDTLTYLLSDHLGSTSMTTDTSGNLLVETRYKPWGEVRYTTPSQTLPTQYTFTGQYSYVADEATDLGNAGFGLMFYNARWYDPSLGRFAQADSIVPGGVQGLDRYAYVNNSPINYIDPTGHNPATCGPDGIYCGGGKWVNPRYPDKVDPSLLSDKVYKGSGVSGEMMYQFYLDTWEQSPNGHLTIKQFAKMIISHEFEPYQNSDGSLNIESYYKDQLQAAMTNWYWGLMQPQGATTTTPESILNWMSAFGSAGMAYRAGTLTGTKADPLANEILNTVFNTPGIQGIDPLAPMLIGNLSMFPIGTISNASQGTAYDQYVAVWGLKGDDLAYIVSLCQVAFFKGDLDYVDDQCR